MNISFVPYTKRRLEGLIPPMFGEYIFGQTGKCNRVFDTNSQKYVLCEASGSSLISEIYLFEVAKFCGYEGTEYSIIHELMYESAEAILHEMFHQLFIYNKEYIKEDEVRKMAEALIREMRKMRIFGKRPRGK